MTAEDDGYTEWYSGVPSVVIDYYVKMTLHFLAKYGDDYSDEDRQTIPKRPADELSEKFFKELENS